MSETQQVYVDYLTGKIDAVKTAEKLDELIQRNTNAIINIDIKKASLEKFKRELKALRYEAEGKAIQFKADAESAKSKIELLKNQLDGLQRERSILLNVDVSDLQAKIAAINSEINSLESKRVSFKVDIEEIDAQIKQLEAQKAEIRATVDSKEAKAQIKDIERQIANLKEQRAKVLIDDSEALRSINALKEDVKELDSEINKRRELALGSKEVDLVNQKIETTKNELESLKGYELELKDNFTEESNRIKQIDGELDRVTEEERQLNVDGKNAQQELRDATKESNLLGQSLSKIPTIGQSITSSFSNVSRVFKTISTMNPFGRILRLATGTVVSKATSALIGNVSGAIERYDTLKTSALALQGIFGTEAKTVKQVSNAMDELDQSVRGLPTSLDEIVGSAKQFMTITNDIERGTQIAIATNRAFLASGSDTQQTYYGTKQLQDLLSAGKLRTQEWESLFKAMPLALRSVSKELGYENDEFGEFRQNLKAGKIDVDEFFDALIKSGYESEGEIYKLAENAKQTINAVLTNWSIAVKRGYVELFNAFDEISKEFTGKSLIDNLIGFGKEIDATFEELSNYVKENKEYFYELAQTLKSFPFKSVLSGFGAYLKMWANILTILTKVSKINPKAIESLTLLFAVFGPIAKLTSLIAQMGMAIDGLEKGRKAGKAVSTGGILGRLLGSKKQVKEATSTAKEITEGAGDVVATTGKTALSIEQAFAGLISALTGVIKVGATVAVVEGAVWGLAKVAKELKSIGEVDWGEVLENVGMMTMVFAGIASLLKYVGQLGKGFVVDELWGAAIIGIAEIFIDLSALLTSASFKKSAEMLSDGIEDITDAFSKLERGIQIKLIEKNVKDMMSIVSLLTEMMSGKAGPEAMTQTNWSMLAKSTQQMLEAISPLVAISDGLAKVQANTKDVDISDTIDSLGESIASIKSTLVKIKETRLEDYRGAVSVFEENLDSLAEATTHIKNIAANIDLEVDWNAVKTKLQDAVNGIEEAMSAIDVEPVQTLEGYKDTNIQPKLEAFKKAVSELSEAVTQISSIGSSFNELDVEEWSAIWGESGKFVNAINGIQTAFDAIKAIDGLGGPTKLAERGLIPELTDSLQSQVEDFAELLKSMSGISSYISEIGSNINDLQWENVGTNLTTAISDIKSALSFDGENLDFETLTSNADSLSTVMASVQLIADNISKIEASLGDVGNVDIKTTLVNTINGIKEALNQMEVEDGLQDKANQLNEIANTIKTALNKIKKAAASASGDYGFGKLASAIGDCVNKLNELNGIEIKPKEIKVTDKFSTPIASFKKQMKSARKENNIVKSITVNKYTVIKPTINTDYPHTGGKITEHGLQYRAKGGLVTKDSTVTKHELKHKTKIVHVTEKELQYRAKGGSIFKPKGTDTVPAMLTPGEYVVKRSAVQKFGVDFMQKINHLDVNGALRDLSYRAGQKISTITSTKNIKNITNNNKHNDVTINNNYKHVSNPEFRAGRFVRSLG